MPFNHFDFISPLYARTRFDPSHPLIGMLDLPGNGLILDIGGGTGRVARLLTGAGRRVVVVDVSPGMLLRARGQPGMWPVMADSSHLPFHSLSAARVLIVDALHHIRRQQETIDELCRILEPGGILVVDEPDLRSFAVKLIRIVELLLLMGSHFLTQAQLQNMFNEKKGVMKILTWRGSLLLQFKK